MKKGFADEDARTIGQAWDAVEGYLRDHRLRFHFRHGLIWFTQHDGKWQVLLNEYPVSEASLDEKARAIDDLEDFLKAWKREHAKRESDIGPAAYLAKQTCQQFGIDLTTGEGGAA